MWKIRSDYRGSYMNLNNRGSVQSINISDYLDLVLYYLIIVLVVVFTMMTVIIRTGLKRKIGLRNVEDNYCLEIIWIALRAWILLLIGIRSIWLLYSIEEIVEGSITVKVTGVQWYWKYNISDSIGNSISFDSYTLDDDDVSLFRLIEVDNVLYLRVLTNIRLLVTSLDVILSFAVRSLGFKVDAVRCRLNSNSLCILRRSTYIGYCSELCGNSLSKMNIVVKGVSLNDFLVWFDQWKEEQ